MLILAMILAPPTDVLFPNDDVASLLVPSAINDGHSQAQFAMVQSSITAPYLSTPNQAFLQCSRSKPLSLMPRPSYSKALSPCLQEKIEIGLQIVNNASDLNPISSLRCVRALLLDLPCLRSSSPCEHHYQYTHCQLLYDSRS
jgi:hypothetical protein